MFSLLLITSAFATVTDGIEGGAAELEQNPYIHDPAFKVEFVVSTDFKPTFHADPRAIAGMVIADTSENIGFTFLFM